MKLRRTPAFIAARMTRQKSRCARDAKVFTLAGKNTGIFIATDSINMTKMTQCKPWPNDTVTEATVIASFRVPYFHVVAKNFAESASLCRIRKMGLVGMEGHFCMPFVVDYVPGRGRFLRASRDIEPGETILIDRPFVQAPPAKSPPICLQCSKLLSTVENSYQCSK